MLFINVLQSGTFVARYSISLIISNNWRVPIQKWDSFNKVKPPAPKACALEGKLRMLTTPEK